MVIHIRGAPLRCLLVIYPIQNPRKGEMFHYIRGVPGEQMADMKIRGRGNATIDGQWLACTVQSEFMLNLV